ncbi:branched-subunit amino acid ABC-type transport system permease component [Rhodoligotrophos appendicifer]|uniref:branched-chain amino acid ABC transporter permease n=1 Tax=Rhodoligotrophos appendicifer TaxID=987056 RepID=UPI001184F6E4|nr:branched-chain amino acid ABC transporter permease [Rhodoligotrophos appendicifer]
MIEFIIRGLVIGLNYGLLAMPLSLLFVATGTVDFALGSYAVLAAGTAFVVGGTFGLGFGVLAAVAAACCIGLVSELLRRRGSGDHLALVLASFGFAVFLQSLALSTLGKDPFTKNLFDVYWQIMGISISPQAGINLVVALTFLGLLMLVLFKTSLGRSIRAAAVNAKGATLAGVPVELVRFFTFVAAGILSGVAGLLYLYTFGLDYSVGMDLTLAGFGAAVIFGIHSPLRGFFGGLAIGIVEALSTAYAPNDLTILIPLVFIFVILIMRPAQIGAGGRA